MAWFGWRSSPRDWPPSEWLAIATATFACIGTLVFVVAARFRGEPWGVDRLTLAALLFVLASLLLSASWVLLAVYARWRKRDAAAQEVPHGDAPVKGRNEREVFVGKTFVAERLDVDGRRFENCVFKRCILRFTGERPPEFVRCTFESPTWAFDAPASNIMGFLAILYEASPETVEPWLQQIRGQAAKPDVGRLSPGDEREMRLLTHYLREMRAHSAKADYKMLWNELQDIHHSVLKGDRGNKAAIRMMVLGVVGADGHLNDRFLSESANLENLNRDRFLYLYTLWLDAMHALTQLGATLGMFLSDEKDGPFVEEAKRLEAKRVRREIYREKYHKLNDDLRDKWQFYHLIAP